MLQACWLANTGPEYRSLATNDQKYVLGIWVCETCSTTGRAHYSAWTYHSRRFKAVCSTTHCHLRRGNCQQKYWKDQSPITMTDLKWLHYRDSQTCNMMDMTRAAPGHSMQIYTNPMVKMTMQQREREYQLRHQTINSRTINTSTQDQGAGEISRSFGRVTAPRVGPTMEEAWIDQHTPTHQMLTILTL